MGEAATQTAQCGVSAARLADYRAVDAACAVKGDYLAIQRCRLIQERALEDVSVIAVVSAQVIEVIVVEDHAEGLTQTVDVPGHISRHVWIADQ